MDIAENLQKIRKSIPEGISIVVVTKTQPVDKIMRLYGIDQRLFGENRVQELVSKYERLPKDIEWHMVGHLQSNKVKYIAPFISLIHSVDSIDLLSVINKEAKKYSRVIPCLLQIKIAREETKFGLSVQDAGYLLGNDQLTEFSNIRIIGLMGMATFTHDYGLIRKEFKKLHSIFITFQKKYFSNSSDFKELSMGMSQDYQIAIEEGATYIRIGTSIFGERISV
jgi:pyridoxal phosphate enzyme (YggS family)